MPHSYPPQWYLRAGHFTTKYQTFSRTNKDDGIQAQLQVPFQSEPREHHPVQRVPCGRRMKTNLEAIRKIEENPMLSINVKLWKSLAVLFATEDHKWRVYAFVFPVCVLNGMQFVYLTKMWGDLAPFILNLFFWAAIFDALLRTCIVIYNRDHFERFLMDFVALFEDIQNNSGTFGKEILKEAIRNARKISIFNLSASFCDIIGALLYPLFVDGRAHPFGVALPGVDMTKFPIYEIAYALQFPTPLVLTVMYMPFVSLFASFAMFGKAMLTVLCHRLQEIDMDIGIAEEIKYRQLRGCIQYYSRICRYVNNFNSLVTYIVFVEFLLFGAIISSLLFCINIIDSFTQIISIIMYIFTMLYVLFTYYWHANELLIESVRVSQVAFNMQWYQCGPKFGRTLLSFITRSQEPLKITVGNIYPMSLQTFQSLLNASYSYFTMLRGITSKN